MVIASVNPKTDRGYFITLNKLKSLSYSLDNSDGTYDREMGALIKLTKTFDSSRLMTITYSQERTIEIDNKTIEVLPIWKWLLD